MKTSPLNLLRVEDYPKDQQAWLSQLFGNLNGFLTSTSSALLNGLDFNSNTLGQQQTLSFTWTSSAVNLPLKFKLTMNGVPNSLIVSKATENKVPVILLCAWQVLNGQVQLTDIAKVASGVVSSPLSGASYILTVRLET